ncbi:uncharacterized protein LOC128871545 isoform X1 [Anastrepha ludens]|uniref:uncharacterized protein LOC128871545 isoform X1 n=1 Tax=Anastrepha ludens TaxID=28586 RepID=UPI0023B12B1F|nr:uncharacterized protein LOC128871545 isoform X1 [Anastrepha ludens]
MGGKSNATFLKNARIQKEQLQLCKIQKELENILGKVNEAINELKVEELQLKAGAAAVLSENYRSSPLNGIHTTEQPSTSSSAILSITQLPPRADYSEAYRIPSDNDDNASIDAVIINNQIIDLNMKVGKNSMEEEEDEDMCL